MNWAMHHSFEEWLPYIAIHIFIIVQMVVNSIIWRKMSVPDHSDPQKGIFHLETAKALVLGSAALIAPAAVSINWGIS